MPVLRLSRLVLRVSASLPLLLATAWAAAALGVDCPASRVLASQLGGLDEQARLEQAVVH